MVGNACGELLLKRGLILAWYKDGKPYDPDNEEKLTFEEHFLKHLADYALFAERNFLENNEHFLQIIPYVIIRNDGDKYEAYARRGSEKRLHNRVSIGFGGHVDYIPDAVEPLSSTGKLNCQVINEIIANAIERELSEEVILQDTSHQTVPITFVGTIHCADTEVDRVHIGLIYLTDNKVLQAAEDDLEVMGSFTKDELLDMHDKGQIELENWSLIALRSCLE